MSRGRPGIQRGPRAPAALTMAIALSLAGCIWIPPPKVEITSPLAGAPRLTYDGLLVRALVDSTGAQPNPKLCRMLMAETIKHIIYSHTFKHIAVEDTSVLEAATVREVPRKELIPSDSLLGIAQHVAECTITLREYNKGDAVNRVLLGVLAGGGAVAIEMRLSDQRLGHVIISGTARKTIRGMYASEYDVAKPLADAVAFFFHQHLKKMARQAAQEPG